MFTFWKTQQLSNCKIDFISHSFPTDELWLSTRFKLKRGDTIVQTCTPTIGMRVQKCKGVRPRNFPFNAIHELINYPQAIVTLDISKWQHGGQVCWHPLGHNAYRRTPIHTHTHAHHTHTHTHTHINTHTHTHTHTHTRTHTHTHKRTHTWHAPYLHGPNCELASNWQIEGINVSFRDHIQSTVWSQSVTLHGEICDIKSQCIEVTSSRLFLASPLIAIPNQGYLSLISKALFSWMDLLKNVCPRGTSA